jgi:RHS repeat-associated protein
MAYFGPIGDELLQKISFTTQTGVPLSQFVYAYNADDNLTSFTESYLNQNPAIIAATGSSAKLPFKVFAAGIQGAPSTVTPIAHSAFLMSALEGLGAVVLITFVIGLGRRAYINGWRWRLILAAVPVVTVAIVAGCGVGSNETTGTSSLSQSSAKVEKRPHPPTSDQVTSYSYDAANRLVSAFLSAGTGASVEATPQFAYGYDRASNLTSIAANSDAKTYQYNDTNGLAAASYDENGNPTRLGTTQYSWDGFNRLVGFAAGTSASQFVYDGLGRLVRIIDRQGGRIVKDRAYFWCGVERCLEHDNTIAGSPVSKQYFSQGVIIGGTPYYYVVDHLGSIRQLVTAGGQVAAQYDYDPYGNQLKVSGEVDADIGYAGYFYHAPTGLNFALYRAYDASHGRWLNRDPIGEAGGVNLYGYVQGNPPNTADALGLCDDDPCSKLADKITQVRDELAKRADELRRDPLGLPLTGPMSIAGHQQQFVNKQTQLRNLLNDFNSQGCGGGTPADAWSFATMPTPSPVSDSNSQSFLQLMSQLTGLTGTALLIYIALSEGSRLFPPRNLVPVP